MVFFQLFNLLKVKLNKLTNVKQMVPVSIKPSTVPFFLKKKEIRIIFLSTSWSNKCFARAFISVLPAMRATVSLCKSTNLGFFRILITELQQINMEFIILVIGFSDATSYFAKY